MRLTPLTVIVFLASIAVGISLWNMAQCEKQHITTRPKSPDVRHVGTQVQYWRPRDVNHRLRTALPARHQRLRINYLNNPYRRSSFQTHEMTSEQCQILARKSGKVCVHHPHNDLTALGRCELIDV